MTEVSHTRKVEVNRINESMSENLLTLLSFDPKNGRLITGLVTPEDFTNETYQMLARRLFGYWEEHDKPPGKAHISDVVSDIVQERRHPQRETMQAIIRSMIVLYDPDSGINTTFVMDMVQKFRREAEWRRTIMEGAEIISRDKHNGIGKIEEMFEKVLRSRPQQADDYLHGDDLNGLIEFLETRKEREFSLGIAPFDRRGVVPTRGELMVLLGISGAGKSWGLIQTGKCALMQGKKVLHVTLELSAQQVQQRMCQNFLALAKEEKDLSTPITRLRLNRQDELIGFGIDQSVAEFSLEDVKRVAKLRKAWGAGIGGRLKQLRIKQFPTGTLTLSQLRACLDQLETTGFVPDLLLLDYVGLMKTSADNKRIDLGRNVEGLRGLAMERNLALVTAQQINRDGVTSKIISRAHIAEDYSMICTADTVLILNRTLKEAQHKVARLWVDKARSTAQDFGAVITQNYEHGQFAIQASGFTGHDRVLEMVDQLPERAPAV